MRFILVVSVLSQVDPAARDTALRRRNWEMFAIEVSKKRREACRREFRRRTCDGRAPFTMGSDFGGADRMLTRRTLLQGTGLGVAALSAGSASFSQPMMPTLADLKGGLIDMHCHIFNASDLPTYGFLRKVLLKIYDEQSLEDAGACKDKGATGVTRWASEAAANFGYSVLVKGEKILTATAEMGQLDKPSQASESHDHMSDLDIIGDQLEAFAPKKGPSPASDDETSKDGVDTLFRRGDTKYAKDRKAKIRSDIEEGKAEFYDQLSKEIGIRLRDAEGKFDPDAPPSPAADEGPEDAKMRDRQRKRDIAARVCSGDGMLSRYICWVRKLKASRWTLATELQAFGKEPKGKFALYVPLLVDYSAWLENEPDEGSSLKDQVAVMEKIALRSSNPKFHAFVAYDPLRDVHENGAALSLAREGVLERGMLGVKLYPPMGFRPWENVGAPISFPKQAQWMFDGVSTRSLDRAGLARELDRRLGEVYAWCAKEDVPIIAHATNSYGSGPCYAERADTKHWGPVLEKYRNARICLGHFGDFEEAINDETGAPLPKRNLEDTWEWHFGRLLYKYKPEERPQHAYVDVSFFSEVMKAKPDSKLWKAVHDAMVKLIGDFPIIADRMIYGTDWLLLATAANYETHFPKVYDFMRQVFWDADPSTAGARLQGVFRDNAVRFLGLGVGGPSRRRLEAFYKEKNADARFLSQF